MTDITFKEYPKTPRLKRDMLVTEKSTAPMPL